jgi:hypothetical protein
LLPDASGDVTYLVLHYRLLVLCVDTPFGSRLVVELGVCHLLETRG